MFIKTIVFAAVFVAGLGSSLALADNLIVPGTSVGPVILGMTTQELYAAVGEPKDAKIRDDATSYTFDGLEVLVDNDDQVVVRIWATSPRFKTKDGIGVGSSALALVAAYGEPSERDETASGEKTFCYRSFEAYVRDSKVAAILIRKGGCTTGFLYYLR